MATPDKKTSSAKGAKTADKKSDTKEAPSKVKAQSAADTKKAEKNSKK
jgi:hypothetical protein